MKTYDAEAIRAQGAVGKLVSDSRKEGANNVLRRGIVKEYVPSQDFLDDLLVQSLVEQGADRGALLKCPPNSLVVIPVDRGQSHTMDRLLVCYPFYSHFVPPAKPGEMVWYTDGTVRAPDPSSTYWWLTRVVLPDQAEDNNYAHHDRQYWDRQEIGYPNGADGNSSFTLPGDMGAFDSLVESSVSAQEFSPTASPRPVGSPNLTGVFGSHRNGLRFDVEGGRGFSDLFAGSAQPRSRRSSRGWEEYDHSATENDQEGSYQRITDSQARLFLCESARGIEESMGVSDVQLGEESGSSIATPSSDGGAAVLYARDGAFVRGEGFVRVDGGSDSTVLVQSGQILLASRSCRVVSESVVVGSNAALVQIGGDEASEPAVLGQSLQGWNTELLSVLKDLLRNLQGANIPMPTGPPVPLSTVVGPDGPLGSTLSSLSVRLDTLEQSHDDYLSSTISLNPSSRSE